MIVWSIVIGLVIAHAAQAETFRPPTGALNPAVTQATIATTICVKGWTATVRPPATYTNKLKQQLLKTQGDIIPDNAQQCMAHSRNPKCYELDHLYPLEIGGHPTDPNNLWLQSYRGPWNAHQKDQLENLIHKKICSGEMSLQEGQSVFNDWKAGYQKYIDR